MSEMKSLRPEEVRDQAWLLATQRLAEVGIEPARTPELGDIVHVAVDIGINAGMQALAERLTAKFRTEEAT